MIRKSNFPLTDNWLGMKFVWIYFQMQWDYHTINSFQMRKKLHLCIFCFKSAIFRWLTTGWGWNFIDAVNFNLILDYQCNQCKFQRGQIQPNFLSSEQLHALLQQLFSNDPAFKMLHFVSCNNWAELQHKVGKDPSPPC